MAKPTTPLQIVQELAAKTNGAVQRHSNNVAEFQDFLDDAPFNPALRRELPYRIFLVNMKDLCTYSQKWYEWNVLAALGTPHESGEPVLPAAFKQLGQAMRDNRARDDLATGSALKAPTHAYVLLYINRCAAQYIAEFQA